MAETMAGSNHSDGQPKPDRAASRRTRPRLRRVALLGLVVPTVAWLSAQEREGQVRVRYPEGTLHGFLQLRTPGGKVLADGDLLQVPRDGGIDSRMVFRFADSSYFDERVRFTQRTVFRMTRYSLVQRGPAFEHDLEATLSSNGKYVVTARSRENGERERWEGTFDDLPADTYNGMVITIAKNLVRGDTQRVHLVAFTPRPRLISLEIAPSGVSRIPVGRRSVKATHFELKPKLGVVLGFFARMLGKAPPDSHAWIVADGAPGFVRFEGPLYTGAVWRLELAAPAFGR
jgi:hypothetical protein